MKQIRTIILMFATALTIMWGCSKESEKEPGYTFSASEYPSWKVDWTWHDEAPHWQNPDPNKYESRMYVILKLNYEYEPYCTADDRIALFYDGECRGVSGAPIWNSDYYYFLIMAAGTNSISEQKMDIRYYCASMKQIFDLPSFHNFIPSYTIGDTYDQEFPFGYGSSKYPYFQQFTIQVEGNVPFTPGKEDMVGVFVNGECRGTGRIGEEFIFWKRQTEETFQFCYYSSANAGIYTIKTPVTITDDADHVININF